MLIERKHRLPSAAYIGVKTVAITACTEDRRAFLNDPQVVDEFVEQLKNHADKYSCLIPIYCFMPDHLHVLIQGTEPRSRPKQVMDEFKGTSGYWLVKHRPGNEWQTSYYDHIIRRHQDLKSQAFYIFNNPVRKGICEDPYGYPYTGSIGYELDAWFQDLCW